MKTKSKSVLAETKQEEVLSVIPGNVPGGSKFTRHLRISLENYTDAEWLGAHSPLATPYFLGISRKDAGASLAPNAMTRGRALQALLRKSVESLTLNGKEGVYSQQILDLRFIHPHAQDYVYESLNVSRATYYRHEARALDLLENALLQQAQPALRQEAPLPPTVLIAREDLIAENLIALQDKKTVAILGGVGLGKTTLGSAISIQWASGATFWYTFRLGLNDQITSLLFSLGHFLNLAGASSLWLQLVTDHGRTALPMVEGLLRHDLDTLEERLPLLCFDEVDVLRPEELESHAQLAVLLTSLYRRVPTLLMGQATRPQRLLQVDTECLLDPLKVEDVSLLYQKLGMKASDRDIAQLTDYTKGNLRLLHLCAAAWRPGTSLNELIDLLPETPQVETIILRLYQKLQDGERQLLKSLCIFNQASPADVWDEDLLWRLQTSGLALLTSSNTVDVLAAAVPIIRNLMTDEERRECHLQAAQILEGRGLFTAAAHHYIEAEAADVAVIFWARHKQSEIDQGLARPTLDIFDRLATQPLQPNTQEQVVLIRSELQMLLGELDKASENLALATWKSNSRFRVAAQILKADISLAQGNHPAVQDQLDEEMGQMMSIVEGLPFMHLRMAEASYSSGDMAAALRKTLVAECEVRISQGLIYLVMGDQAASRRYFGQALELAEALGDKRMMAKVQIQYAQLLIAYRQEEEALIHLKACLDYYQQIGNLRWAVQVRCSLAATYLSMNRLPECIELASHALKDAEVFNYSHGIMRAAYCLTEAYLQLNNLQQAEIFLGVVCRYCDVGNKPHEHFLTAKLKFQQALLADAVAVLKDSILGSQEKKYRSHEASGLQLLGRIYQTQGDLILAQEAFHLSLERFTELGMLDEMEKSQSLLQQCIS